MSRHRNFRGRKNNPEYPSLDRLQRYALAEAARHGGTPKYLDFLREQFEEMANEDSQTSDSKIPE